MTDRIQHGTIHAERHYPVPVARVFAAWADPDARKRWEPVPDGFEMHHGDMAFEVGGSKTSRMTRDGVELASFDQRFVDIVDLQRIVITVVVRRDDQPMSVSLQTVEFRPADGGTLLVCTEQVAWLDGTSQQQEHQGGWANLLDRLGVEVRPD